jgi:EAL domain-containing protein (putative c-di-GMP-specific phosphodiesterase class I)/CheY-like chemotaxis protein
MDGRATAPVERPLEALRTLHRHLDAVESRLRLWADGSDAAGIVHGLHQDTARLHAATSALDVPWADALASLVSALDTACRNRRMPGKSMAARLLAATERTRKKLPPPAHPGTVSTMSDADDRTRAEFPPTHYWRRWAADAAAPESPGEDTADPLAELPALVAARHAETAESAANAPYRVLIVEDDPSQALFAESVINGAGMQALVAAAPGEVMASLEAFRPDLVLMDLHMPGMDGVELTGMIRGHADLGRVPIVFLTGDPDPERQFEVLDIGADDFLTKPVRPRHLVLTVQNRVRRARALQGAAAVASGDRHPVTGLHTRPQMLQLLSGAIGGPCTGGLFILEIEGTGALRDRFGYAALEAVLTDAGRHVGILADGRAATRLNDNTFLVFATDLADPDLPAFARALRDGLGRQPFEVDGQTLRLRGLVGYVSLTHGFDNAGAALVSAEQALRSARGNPIGIADWQPTAQPELQQDAELTDMVREAAEGHGFELAFQPIVAVAGGDEAQFQTLARMRDRDGRLYTAAEFLPAAEAAGLLHEVDLRVLELAIDTMQRRLGEGRVVRLFVTQSARSLTRDGYAAELLTMLQAKGVDGPSLVIDVRQEDALIHALSLQEFCSAMVPAGVQLCLSQYRPDDEARALLAQLPLGFVRLSARYSSGLDDARLRDEMRDAIEQAHRLGLQVIGQQVEDPQAAATLWMSGVDFIQGNLVQRAAGGLDFDFQHSVL